MKHSRAIAFLLGLALVGVGAVWLSAPWGMVAIGALLIVNAYRPVRAIDP